MKILIERKEKQSAGYGIFRTERCEERLVAWHYTCL